MANVGLIFGGRSVEHRVSVSSARTVAAALGRAGHRVTPLGIATDGCWVEPRLAAAALAGELAALPPVGKPVAETLAVLLGSGVEVLFPLIHGTWGEDGTLQGLCEMLDLPYAGAGVTASAVAMDKLCCKQLLASAGLPVVDFEAVDRREWERAPERVLERLARLPSPLFVKPSVGGSSVGVSRVDVSRVDVSRVDDRETLADAVAHALRFDDRVVVERGVAGRELECAVLGYGEIAASAVGEIVPGKAFYDYADKYLDDGAQLIAPADLPEATAAELRAAAVRAFAAVGGWGMARVDFLLEAGGRLFVNEINTVPGFTSISMYPRLWEISGVSNAELVDRLVRIAIERHRDRRRLDEGIKAWIAELASRPQA